MIDFGGKKKAWWAQHVDLTPAQAVGLGMQHPKPVLMLFAPLLIVLAALVIFGPGVRGAGAVFAALPHMPITGEATVQETAAAPRAAVTTAALSTTIRWQND